MIRFAATSDLPQVLEIYDATCEKLAEILAKKHII